MDRLNPRRALFIRTDRLGETLLNLPAAAALKATFPQARLTLLVSPDLAPLLQALPWVDQVMSYASGPKALWWKRALELAKRLRESQCQVVLVSNPQQELHVAVWMAGIPIRVGYHRKWGRLLTHRLADRKALGERHEVEYNLDLIRALGLPFAIPDWRFPPFLIEQREVLQLLEEQGIKTSAPFIAVHPWSSNPIKRWPIDRFQMLIQRLVEQEGRQIVIIGGPEEQASAREVAWPSQRVANLVGRLNLRQLAALFQRAALLVSNDSGPVHLAAAANTKTVVLFGTSNPATGPGRWGPWGNGHRVILKPSIDAIAVDEVLEAINQQCG